MTDNKKLINQDEEGDQGEDSGTGQGGVAGEVQFRYKEAMSLGPRDDALPPSEIKRLLSVHQDLHKERVKKQKITRKERKALKSGLRAPQNAARGMGQGFGGGSKYKQHPITLKAQFSGMDPQVSILPNENNANTNEVARNELELRNNLEHRYNLQNSPKFNPKPRPF